MKTRIFAAALALLFWIAGPLPAAVHPPETDWQTLETTHFLIHFNRADEATARRLAAMAEPIFNDLSRDLKWVPEDKTHVLVIGYLDLTNGSATPYPYNTVEIYTTPPAPNSQLGDYDDWLRLVFTHEFTHILHLDQGTGPAKISRDLLGRNFIPTVAGLPVPLATFPNELLPIWMIEGYATLDETRHTTAGRGDSTYTRMLLRMAVLDDRFFPLDKGAGLEGEWPGGAFRYLYGEAFLSYLTAKYGIDKVNAMYRLYASGMTPLLIDIPAYSEFNTTLESEWEKWHRMLIRQAKDDEAQIAREGETLPARLTFSAWETRHPRLSPDGRTIYHSVTNNREYPHVNAYDTVTGKDRFLFERNGNMSAVAPSPDGRSIYFTQIEAYRKYAYLGDAFCYDLGTGRVERQTSGERLLAIDVSHDGRWAVGVRNLPEGQSLVLYRVEPGRLVRDRTLVSGNGRVFDEPRFSPDGTRIAYAGWIPGGFADVYVAGLDGSERRLTSDRFVDAAPTFTRDGKQVIFSSDRSGIYNLYSVPATSSGTPPVRLTNVAGGLFESDAIDDQTAVAASYGGDGLDLARVSLSPRPATGPAQPERDAYVSRYPSSFSGASHPYRPGQSLWPRAWTPIVNLALFPGSAPMSLEAGLQTQGNDVLGWHAYDLTAVYNRELQRPGASGSYTYDRLDPTISAAAEDMPVHGALQANRGEDARNPSGIRSRAAQAMVSVPFPTYRSSHQLAFAYLFGVQDEFGTIRHPGEALTRRRGHAALQWAYSSAHQYGISLGPQDGMRASITAQYTHENLGASYRGALALADARQYWHLGSRQVLALQGQAGLAQPDGFAGPFSLGGASPRVSLGDVGSLPLRGFGPDSASGNKIAKGGAEYRFPLGLIKRGIPCWGTFPFLADQFHGALFTEGGSAWMNLEKPRWMASAGAELILDFTVGYSLPLQMGLGAAVPLTGQAGRRPQLFLVTSNVDF